MYFHPCTGVTSFKDDDLTMNYKYLLFLYLKVAFCCFFKKKDEYVEVESSDMQVLDQQHICAFIEVIKDITAKIRQGKYLVYYKSIPVIRHCRIVTLIGDHTAFLINILFEAILPK